MKKSSIKSYFDSIILETINVPYSLESKFSKQNSTEYNTNLEVKLNSLDKMITWKLDTCWQSEKICSDLILDFQHENNLR